jgi:hypothetical protein
MNSCPFSAPGPWSSWSGWFAKHPMGWTAHFYKASLFAFLMWTRVAKLKYIGLYGFILNIPIEYISYIYNYIHIYIYGMKYRLCMYYITTDQIRRMHMRVEELLHQLVTMKVNKYQGSILQHCKSLDCVKGYCPSTWCIIVRNHPQSTVVQMEKMRISLGNIMTY